MFQGDNAENQGSDALVSAAEHEEQAAMDIDIIDPSKRRLLAWRRMAFLTVALGLFIAASVLVGFKQPTEDADDIGSHGLDPSNIDSTCSPQDNFYLYANGNWLKWHSIPDDYSRWDTFTELGDDILDKLHHLLERAENMSTSASGQGVAGKVGAFWKSAMNSIAIEAAGLSPLAIFRQTIHQASNLTSLCAVAGQLHAAGIPVLFDVSAQPDPQDSRMMILWLDQGGLGMPDREYYLDAKYAEIKAKYTTFVKDMLLQAKYSPEVAEAGATSILWIETKLAEASQTKEYRRLPENLLHPYAFDALPNLSDYSFDWDAYAAALDVDLKGGLINLPNPAFVQAAGSLLANQSLKDGLQAYFDFHLLAAMAPALPERFVATDFKYTQVLTGQKAMLPRWKRMIPIANELIGELVGQLYCHEFFPQETKAHALEIIMNVRQSLRQTLTVLPWMGEATRHHALEKLDKLSVKVGFPDKWVDYSALIFSGEAAFAANVLEAKIFNTKDMLSKAWKKVDKALWDTPPQTVNAFYNPTANEIIFPAGILQSPFYSPKFDIAVNYGGMGAVVGHELTHGFDDEGRKYDGDGNLRDWWDAADADLFNAKAALIAKQFSGYKSLGQPVNGEFTQGENIADLGGLNIAYRAMTRVLKANYSLDGLTQDQRFFLAWSQVWRQLIRDAAALSRLATDPHAPSEWRVNGPLANMPEFYDAFDVHPNHPMWRKPEERAIIW